MTSASRRIALAAVAIALVAAACGGSDPVGDAPSTIAEPEASPTHEMLEEDGETDTADHHGSADAPTRYDADVADAEQTISVEVAGGAPVGGHQRVETVGASTEASVDASRRPAVLAKALLRGKS